MGLWSHAVVMGSKRKICISIYFWIDSWNMGQNLDENITKKRVRDEFQGLAGLNCRLAKCCLCFF